MSCGCGKLSKTDRTKNDHKRGQIRALAVREAKRSGEVMVFFLCSDWEFARLSDFNEDGKREIEYLF